MHIVLNKVARPAHGVENLPRANQKTQNFQYDYHSFSHVNFVVSWVEEGSGSI